jgi:hypothetical protein
MNGNICRCCSYIRIRQAIHKAAGSAATPSTQSGPSARKLSGAAK